jgi:hypothetical protein
VHHSETQCDRLTLSSLDGSLSILGLHRHRRRRLSAQRRKGLAFGISLESFDGRKPSIADPNAFEFSSLDPSPDCGEVNRPAAPGYGHAIGGLLKCEQLLVRRVDHCLASRHRMFVSAVVGKF